MFSCLATSSRTRRLRMRFSAKGRIWSSIWSMVVNCRYCSKDSPWLCILRACSSIMLRTCCWIMGSGISMEALATTLSTTLFSFSVVACFCFVSASLARISALYSSRVENSDTSSANSSSSSGSSLALISLTVTLNRAGFPASSFAWYSSGKVTCTSTSSPICFPTSCSSKVSMKEWEPMVRG